MPTLLLRLVGPLQSWGTTSRFDERDSQLEPSKSGVIGLVCAGMGRDRSRPIDDLARLRMGVRVDREGLLMRDYQTATGVVTATGKVDSKRAVVSPRFYLSDAAFLVGLEGTDQELLQRIDAALRNPVWPLSLGRKSFPPAVPVWLEQGLIEQGLRDALISAPRIADPRDAGQYGNQKAPTRLMLEHENTGAVHFDQPIAPFAERRFGSRHIATEVVDLCTSPG